MPAQPVAQAPDTVAEQVGADWPCPGYAGPQPWQVKNPPEITHDRGLITTGAAGSQVTELAAILAALGYPTDISSGRNPYNNYGESEQNAVAAFRAAYGVQEDPQIIAATTPSTVGPWTYEALFRVLRAAQEARG